MANPCCINKEMDRVAYTQSQNMLRTGGPHLAPRPPWVSGVVAFISLLKLQLKTRGSLWAPLWAGELAITWRLCSGIPHVFSYVLSPRVRGRWERCSGGTWEAHGLLKDLDTQMIHDLCISNSQYVNTCKMGVPGGGRNSSVLGGRSNFPEKVTFEMDLKDFESARQD